MLQWLRRRRQFRERAEARADALIARHGENARSVAYSQSREPVQTEDDRALAYAVRRIIEKRLGIRPRVDTATRYLEEP